MASIKKRPNGKWRARYRDSLGNERARHFARKQDAQRWLDGITTSLQTGTYVDPTRARVTVGFMADEWRAGKINLRPTTRARYDAALTTHVLPRWRSVQITKVEHGDIQAWVATLGADGLSGASVRKAFGVLSGILSLAVRDRRLASNPAAGVNLPELRERTKRYLTAVQVEQLASAAGAHRAEILVLAYCGLRWSELAGLKVCKIDLLRRRLEISEAVTEVNGGRLAWNTPKNHERRSVPIPRLVAAELERRLDGKGPDDLVFTSPRGEVLRNRNARKGWFDVAATAIGQKGLTPHELRHTAASLAVSAGAHVKAIQRMLGHASAAMTLDRYADLFDDDLDAVADRLDAVARTARGLPADQLRTEAEVIDLPMTSTGAFPQ